MFSAGLVIAFAGMCMCQQQSAAGAVSQASFQTGTAAVVQQPQTKLDDIERDSLAAAFGQKTQQQQPAKPSAIAAPALPQQQQQQQQQQAYQAVPQQQYFVQPYQAQQQFYVQPYQAQPQQYLSPYQMAFDYSGVQYMIINPNAYNAGNPVYQQYYVPAPQPSAVPQYVTKQSSPAAAVASAPTATQTRQEYKQQKPAAPGQAPQEYQQQQQPYVQVPTAGFQQYVQQPAAVASPVDFSYVTRHPAQFKAPALAVQPQFQFAAVPQQYLQQQQQPQPQQQQYYYNFPAAAGQAAAEQPRVQQSAKSQFSSGVKSTTPAPFKESFAYKFESSPLQQQQSGAAYSTLRYSV